jgi:homoserine dehydrogenase
MSRRTLSIGLFGFGVVGQGLYQLMQGANYRDAAINKVAVKDKSKPRSISPSLITFDANEILEDESIDLIVEAIDDADEAFYRVSIALQKGKPVVTANKKMLALYFQELLELQLKTGTTLLYEAAVCGAIPIVRTLDDSFAYETIQSIRGIFNGTSNYILSKIFRERLEYSLALKQAQDKGFAESDPTSDVGGFDAKYKAVILAKHAFGIVYHPKEVLNIGIDHLSAEDISFARSKGWKIKLVPTLINAQGKVVAFVVPTFVQPEDKLFDIEEELNAVILDAAYSGIHSFTGKGAGAFPTAFSVLNDIRAVIASQSYLYQKDFADFEKADLSEVKIEIYLRFKNPQVKKALAFESIREGFIAEGDEVIIGTTTLKKLLDCRAIISADESAVIGTGKVEIAKKKPEAGKLISAEALD